MGFGGGILMANMTSWMLGVSHQSKRSKRVKSSAYLTNALFMGQFFSPPISHPIVEYFGVKDFFIVCGIILLVVVILFDIQQNISKFKKQKNKKRINTKIKISNKLTSTSLM